MAETHCWDLADYSARESVCSLGRTHLAECGEMLSQYKLKNHTNGDKSEEVWHTMVKEWWTHVQAVIQAGVVG